MNLKNTITEEDIPNIKLNLYSTFGIILNRHYIESKQDDTIWVVSPITINKSPKSGIRAKLGFDLEAKSSIILTSNNNNLDINSEDLLSSTTQLLLSINAPLLSSNQSDMTNYVKNLNNELENINNNEESPIKVTAEMKSLGDILTMIDPNIVKYTKKGKS